MGLGSSKTDFREKATDASTIKKAWKNWDHLFEDENVSTNFEAFHETEKVSTSKKAITSKHGSRYQRRPPAALKRTTSSTLKEDERKSKAVGASSSGAGGQRGNQEDNNYFDLEKALPSPSRQQAAKSPQRGVYRQNSAMVYEDSPMKPNSIPNSTQINRTSAPGSPNSVSSVNNSHHQPNSKPGSGWLHHNAVVERSKVVHSLESIYGENMKEGDMV